MSLEFLITIDMCREAIDKLNSRRDKAAEKLRQLDAGHQQRLLDYLQDRISDDQLDVVLLERARLEALSREDHTLVLEAISKRRDTLLKQAANRRNAEEQYQYRVMFSELWNEIVLGTAGFTDAQANELARLRPGDLDPPSWDRFRRYRTEYAAQPESSRVPYGQYCNIQVYEPKPLDD